jgi:hypothetical protein
VLNFFVVEKLLKWWEHLGLLTLKILLKWWENFVEVVGDGVGLAPTLEG